MQDINIKFLYKFGKKEHLQSLENGCVMFRSAKDYRDMERKSKIKGIGDSRDTAMAYPRNAGSIKNNLFVKVEGREFFEADFIEMTVSDSYTSNLPMFCCSYAGVDNMLYDEAQKSYKLQFDAEEKDKLLKMCKDVGYDSVLLFSAGGFMYALEDAVKPNRIIYNTVSYLEAEQRQRRQIELEEQMGSLEVCFIKDQLFAYQREFRILIENNTIKVPHFVNIGPISNVGIFEVENFLNANFSAKHKVGENT